MEKLKILIYVILLTQIQILRAQEIVVELLPSPVSFSCRAISAVSDDIIWASGSDNTILKSLDGGQSWHHYRPTDSLTLDFRSLYAWSEHEAIAFSTSSPAIGIKTTDGGKTWRQVYRNNQKEVFINSVHFSDEKNGVAVGDPVNGIYLVLNTFDGGETWEADTNAPAGNGGMFAASNGCVQHLKSGKTVMVTGVIGSYVYFKTADTWTKSITPLASGHDNQCDGCYGILMLDENHGFVVGGNYEDVHRPGNIAVTEDGGTSWKLCDSGVHGFTSSIKAFTGDQSTLIAVGSHGMSFSKDSGKTWNDITEKLPAGCKGFHTLSASESGKYLYAAGASGLIARIRK